MKVIYLLASETYDFEERFSESIFYPKFFVVSWRISPAFKETFWNNCEKYVVNQFSNYIFYKDVKFFAEFV